MRILQIKVHRTLRFEGSEAPGNMRLYLGVLGAPRDVARKHNSPRRVSWSKTIIAWSRTRQGQLSARAVRIHSLHAERRNRFACQLPVRVQFPAEGTKGSGGEVAENWVVSEVSRWSQIHENQTIGGIMKESGSGRLQYGGLSPITDTNTIIRTRGTCFTQP